MLNFITVFGNGGDFKVDTTTGLAYDHEHSGEEGHDGYADIEWVDLEEHQKFWGHINGHIDILDVFARLKNGQIIEAEASWRQDAKEDNAP